MADASELFDHIEANTDLDVVAITDHDHIRGAWRARDVWARRKYRFDLIVGIEMTTIEGHLIALFVEDPISSLTRVEEAIEAVHAQRGIAIVPHPMSWLTRSLDRNTILRLSEADSGLHAIETATGSAAGRAWVTRARRLNLDLGLAEVGGSDAHFPVSVGAAHTLFEGKSASDLRNSILSGNTSAANGTQPNMLDIGLDQIARQSWRGFSTTPRTMGLRRTAWSFVRRIFNVR